MTETNKELSTLNNWANLSRSILNGVIGDYLVREKNPLAIDMAFYHQNRALTLDDTLANQLEKKLSNKIVVLVHGLTNLESVWDMPPTEKGQDNYGTRIENEFGHTPFYLRYNTGLSILENGRQFNALLDNLVEVYPINIDEIVLVGFSMGGLLLRGAQKYGLDANHTWLAKLQQCFYIGTPHEGSPLEKFGSLASSAVRMMPKEYISLWADWIDIRSEGIKDLKTGLMNLSTPRQASETVEAESLTCVSFHADAQHYFVSGSISENKLLNSAVGDSLVHQTSAKPKSAPKNSIHQHFEGIPHIPLAHSDDVYSQLKAWFDESKTNTKLRHFTASSASTATKAKSLSNEEIVTGSIDLLASAYQHTVGTVETMQRSISDEPFSVLRKVPAVNKVSEVVEGSHEEILNTIYFSLRAGGKFVHGSSRLATEGLKLLRQNHKDS